MLVVRSLRVGLNTWVASSRSNLNVSVIIVVSRLMFWFVEHVDANHPDGIWYGRVLAVNRESDGTLRYHICFTDDGGAFIFKLIRLTLPVDDEYFSQEVLDATMALYDFHSAK